MQEPLGAKGVESMSDGMLQFDFMGEALMAAVDAIFVKTTGKGGHGALPHRDMDPIVAASSVVMNVQTIVSVFVFIGTFVGSAVIAHVILKAQGII